MNIPEPTDLQAVICRTIRDQTYVGRCVTEDQIHDAIALLNGTELAEGLDLYTAVRMYLVQQVINTDRFQALLDGESA